jgi:hypothetical protein
LTVANLFTIRIPWSDERQISVKVARSSEAASVEIVTLTETDTLPHNNRPPPPSLAAIGLKQDIIDRQKFKEIDKC